MECIALNVQQASHYCAVVHAELFALVSTNDIVTFEVHVKHSVNHYLLN